MQKTQNQFLIDSRIPRNAYVNVRLAYAIFTDTDVGTCPRLIDTSVRFRCFLVTATFERSGTEVAKRGMTSPTVVEELEIVEEVGASLTPRGPCRVVDEPELQRGEEALGDGVVLAIAPAAHAADDDTSSGV